MISLKGINIGEMPPKICVPLVGDTLGGLLNEANLALHSSIDLVEWRADHFNGLLDPQKLDGAFSALKSVPDKPLLFTVRTADEGGNLKITRELYFELLQKVIRDFKPDLIDIELSCGEKYCRELVAAAKSNCVTTVLSSHNFKLTPARDDMLDILNAAVNFGGDIAKIAVMPRSSADVLELLAVSENFSRFNPDTPVIAIAMGELGKISRVTGGFFGSAVTFASLEQESAPGQIPFGDMRTLLNMLY